jgi:Zn-dependent protease with chaperone function
MRNWKKKLTAAVLAAVCLTGTVTPLTVEAATTTQKILYGTAALLFISSYYTRMDDKAGMKLLDQCQQQTGVYESAEADNRVQTIYNNIRSTGAVERNYNVYVAPSEDINAFMSLGGVLCVNKGSLDAFDDDELAYVMAHEISHGEKRHNVNGVKKSVGLITALDIYLGSDASYGEYLLGNIAANYVSNAVFTKDQEKEADDLGFQYLVEAGYNPGGGAASMQVLKDKYGESSPSGIKAVLAPGNHPKTSDRINKNLKWMKAYSGGHVDVKDGWILVNGEKAFQPAASGRYTDKERTYLTAGKLDKLYHRGHVPDAVIEDDTIYCGNTAVYSLSSSEDGKLYVANLNKGIAKDRGEAVESKFQIDSRREKIKEKKEKVAEADGNGVEAGAVPDAG